jgi:hypothetical protein
MSLLRRLQILRFPPHTLFPSAPLVAWTLWATLGQGEGIKRHAHHFRLTPLWPGGRNLRFAKKKKTPVWNTLAEPTSVCRLVGRFGRLSQSRDPAWAVGLKCQVEEKGFKERETKQETKERNPREQTCSFVIFLFLGELSPSDCAGVAGDGTVDRTVWSVVWVLTTG